MDEDADGWCGRDFRQGGARMLWGGFGLAPLAPGDYLMRVIVSVDGKEAGTVTRTLRKVQ